MIKNLPEAPWVVANVIIGSRPEPFFSCCLASVADAVDFLILNDNSGNPENPNLEAFYSSRLYQEGRTALLQTNLSELSGFDEARNLCLEETGKRFGGQNVWILYLDADEVHPPELSGITRKFFSRLPLSVGVVDGYFYQFIQSFDFYYSIDRRHNLFFRYQDKLRWEEPVHEKLRGISGKRVPTGYCYFHYGYVYSPENILRRWQLYKHYGGIPYDPDLLHPETLFQGYEKKMIRFRGKHPEALSLFFEKSDDSHVVQFTKRIEEFLQSHPWYNLWGFIKEANWKLRLAFRNFQASLVFPRNGLRENCNKNILGGERVKN